MILILDGILLYKLVPFPIHVVQILTVEDIVTGCYIVIVSVWLRPVLLATSFPVNCHHL